MCVWEGLEWLLSWIGFSCLVVVFRLENPSKDAHIDALRLHLTTNGT